ncbi:uncharacterized protein [Heterodontus francisci]|uniref:uncharacterized protein n=1 Tax=Heterodontus francisci TaxID=7792 RepID=UPI00355B072A
MGSWISSKKPDDIWIAVAGPNGAGKTSLINALQGDENGGASPDPNTALKIIKYTHPKHANVTFWEIPSNLSSTSLDPYDLLIIVSPLDTFASDCVKFAKEGQAKDKPCYFVRSKIGTDVQQYAPLISSINQLDMVLQDIASSVTNYLAQEGVQHPPIFLVSNTNPDIYQFPLFHSSIEEKIGELNKTKGLIKNSSRQSPSTERTEASGLDMAVFGDHWSGKSTLINALRGLQADDEAAAMTGMGDPDTKPVVYTFPKYPNVRIWELPEISANLQPEQYLKQVNGENYGLFIIVASEIFKAHHSQLSKILQNMGKVVLFVRTKLDGDLRAYKYRYNSKYNENKVVEEIRQFCIECLKKGGVQQAEVYLVSGFDLEKFDFWSLCSRIQNHPDVIKCEIFERVTKEEREEMNKAFESGGVPVIASKILLRLQSLDDVVVNIGITGEAGAGKSSLVNAMRGIPDDQHGAAPTGVTETTMVPTRYTHPIFTNVHIWDLPGLGTPNFQLEKYREQVGFDRYDFFIIVASERFKENHTKLAEWINERGARFYFVRSKVDSDIEASKIRRAAQLNQGQVLEQIREESLKYLEEQGVKSPQVFLVSILNFEEYDFRLLQKTLERELPKYRKQAFLRSIATTSSKIIEKEKNSLSTEIWKLALVSSVAAAAPILGIGIMCDVKILLKYLPIYYKRFGLDEESLERMSLEIEKPLEDLKAQIRSPQPRDINIQLLYKLLSNTAGMGFMAGEYFIRGIPVFGAVVSGGIAFTVTRKMLTSFVQNLAEDAERVLQWVIDSKIKQQNTDGGQD